MQRRNEKTLLFANTVGEMIAELRLNKKLSINKFAHEYDLDVGNTSRVEKGSIEARKTASKTLDEVKKAMKINYFDDKQFIEEQANKYNV